MLKILQTRLQQYMNWELPDGQARFRKSRGTSDQIANICSQEKFQKNICFTDYAKNCDYVDRNKRENSWRDGNTRTPYLPPEKSVCKSRSYKLEPDIEQQSGSKSGKEYVKAVYCHPAYLTYMQSTSCKMLGWMKHRLDSRLPGEISITSDMQMTPPLWQKTKRTKQPLDESERERKSWLKTQHSKNEDRGIQSHQFVVNRWGKQWKLWQTLFSWAPKSLQMVTAAMKLKDTCSLEEKLQST